jgi:hypothetical protein
MPMERRVRADSLLPFARRLAHAQNRHRTRTNQPKPDMDFAAELVAKLRLRVEQWDRTARNQHEWFLVLHADRPEWDEQRKTTLQAVFEKASTTDSRSARSSKKTPNA